MGTTLFIIRSDEKSSLTFLRDEKDLRYMEQKAVYCDKKVNKGEWGMPRLLEATKDVVSCEKLRGFANET